MENSFEKIFKRDNVKEKIMNKKKTMKYIIVVVLLIIVNILTFKYCNLEDKNIGLNYNLKSNVEDTYQLFYSNDEELKWKEENSENIIYSDVDKNIDIKYLISKDTVGIRIDLGNKPAEIVLANMNLSYYGKKIELDKNQILDIQNQNEIEKIECNNGNYIIKTQGNDAYIKYKLNSNEISELLKYKNSLNFRLKIIICILIDILIYIFFIKSDSIMNLLEDLYLNKRLIWNLSKNDFKTKYAGSYLGIIWAFVQPIVTILVYWFVFQFGLRAVSPIKDVPYILWFMSGLVPWFFFQDSLLSATNCMIEYSYLVKKVVFKISILPIVKIISALFVHIVFIWFLFGVASIYGFYPSQHIVQLLYYSFCTFLITLGISYATCSIVIFFRDLGQIISIFLQVGMWMTPIMWSYTMASPKYQWILKLNPMYYIVEGYRDTFINHVWFMDRYFQTAYFWAVTLGLFIIGTIIFNKLKPHFADVL
ncbi:ABC transporter permease [Clostridium butyricum]